MPLFSPRFYLLAAPLVVAPVAVAEPPRPSEQEPAFDVLYTRLEPREAFRYKLGGEAGECSAGVFRWEVPRTEFGTNGLDRTFTGYCAQVRVPVVAGEMYRFRPNNLYDPANYNLAGAPKERLDAATNRRGRLVGELFARHFRDPVRKPTNPTDAVAFQVALWEVVHEAEPAEGNVALDLFAGDFRANYPQNEAPQYVARAQEYLGTLTGTEEALATENADLTGRELIRLQGVENAKGIVAQAQFALRYAGGGAGGAGTFARALTAGGGGGGPGIVPLGGGPGGSGGGGGLGIGGNGGGGGPNNPNQPPPSSPPPVSPPPPGGGDVPPPGNPPPPDVEIPPGGGPNDPVPVPAPAGLALGAVALVVIGIYRRDRLFGRRAPE
ncbi:hypothetical protein R5W23_002566 [Gemmata sp. JC673]|uniref:Thioester domain-containing protein n=1 Tax=Gemmata algarum TaxID=2975278 RepID=A0ABU5F272_9BACT|nr:hypothetical protein [Gemmata algarum]MDY3561289.1 hypothetical protein [Gemmata algarum]